MPSYIEFDKTVNFPASSNVGKVIFGINDAGQAVTVNNLGVELPLSQSFISASYAVTASYALNGGGVGGTGLIIPKPIVYATIGKTYPPNDSHTYGDPLPGSPGTITNSWNPGMLKLTYQTSDLTFLNYNPKYFLFIYKGANTFGPANVPARPNTRINNEKFGKYFAHPSNLSGSVGGTLATVPTYTNFSNHGGVSGFTSSFDKFTTEWSIATGSGQPTILEGFDPKRFYYAKSGSIDSIGAEFFPWPVGISGSGDLFSTTTVKHYRKTVDAPNTPPIPRKNIYIKFAIVVQDPSNPSRYIIGPMSDTVKIYPAEGYFNNGVTTQKYYYAWKTRLA